MKYRCIIWDWNGTLLNDAFLCRDVMNGLLRSRNLPVLSARRYREVFDFPVSRYYGRLGFDFARDSFEELGTAFIRAYEVRKHSCRLQPHARALLDRLHRQGVRQAILSAYRHDTLTTLLDEKKLTGYFDWILGADDHYAHGKQAQGMRLIKQIGKAAGNILLAGDTVHDYDVARAIGVDCALVEGGHQTADRLRGCGCPVFANLRQLAHWMERR